MTWTAAWAEAQASVPTDRLVVSTLELINSAFRDSGNNQISIRAVNNTEDLQLPLEASAPLNPGTTVTFTAIPFAVPWPDAQDAQVPKLVIRLDNVGQELESYLAVAVTRQEPIIVVFRVYVIDRNTGVATLGIDPCQFTLRSVKITDAYVEGEASLADLQNIQFCRVIYDIQHYPGLTRA